MNTKYSCGGCTACCTTHGVYSIQKQPGSNCPSCSIGTGCTIYERRPHECRSFTCSWILGNGGGAASRPDRTGVVPVHEVIPEVGVLLILKEYREGALNSEFIFKWTRRNLMGKNFTIHKPIVGNSRFYLPKGEGVSLETQSFFEEYWKSKIDFISYESFLHGLVL